MKTISLTRGMVTLVDDEDFPLVGRYKWYAQSCGGKFYAARRDRASGKIVLMHREIMGPQDGQVVDHRNHKQTLDNRRSNLRIATHAQNHQNAPKRTTKTSSQYKGVSKFRDKWQAYIQIDGKKVNIGTFGSELAAAFAYNLRAFKAFGDFAVLNRDSHGNII